MAKKKDKPVRKAGRPKAEATYPTVAVRLSPDLAAKISVITRFHGGNSAEYLDNLIRDILQNDFEKVLPEIESLAKTSAVAKEHLERVAAAEKLREDYERMKAAKAKADKE